MQIKFFIDFPTFQTIISPNKAYDLKWIEMT